MVFSIFVTVQVFLYHFAPLPAAPSSEQPSPMAIPQVPYILLRHPPPSLPGPQTSTLALTCAWLLHHHHHIPIGFLIIHSKTYQHHIPNFIVS